MGQLRLTGTVAHLHWGYRSIATLQSWEIVHGAEVSSLTGAVARQDPVAVSQRPLTFVVPRPDGAWRWPVVSLQIEGASLTAVLGPKESA